MKECNREEKKKEERARGSRNNERIEGRKIKNEE
jgi:hypothetical protein